MPNSITINIRGIGPVLLERSTRARRMNISVRPFRGIRVAVPKGASFKIAEQFARSKTEWLKGQIARMRELEEMYRAASSKEVTINRKEARNVLVKRLDEIAQRHGYRYNRVSIRNQKTRWGSCSSQNNISLNMKLTQLPDELRDFIILHELVHTKVKNHGNKFWDEIMRAEPRAEELARQVKQYCIQHPAHIFV